MYPPSVVPRYNPANSNPICASAGFLHKHNSNRGHLRSFSLLPLKPRQEIFFFSCQSASETPLFTLHCLPSKSYVGTHQAKTPHHDPEPNTAHHGREDLRYIQPGMLHVSSAFCCISSSTKFARNAVSACASFPFSECPRLVGCHVYYYQHSSHDMWTKDGGSGTAFVLWVQ